MHDQSHNVHQTPGQTPGTVLYQIHVASRVQKNSFLQLAIQASRSQHLLAQTSFQLAPKPFD